MRPRRDATWDYDRQTSCSLRMVTSLPCRRSSSATNMFPQRSIFVYRKSISQGYLEGHFIRASLEFSRVNFAQLCAALIIDLPQSSPAKKKVKMVFPLLFQNVKARRAPIGSMMKPKEVYPSSFLLLKY